MSVECRLPNNALVRWSSGYPESACSNPNQVIPEQFIFYQRTLK